MRKFVENALQAKKDQRLNEYLKIYSVFPNHNHLASTSYLGRIPTQFPKFINGILLPKLF